MPILRSAFFFCISLSLWSLIGSSREAFVQGLVVTALLWLCRPSLRYQVLVVGLAAAVIFAIARHYTHGPPGVVGFFGPLGYRASIVSGTIAGELRWRSVRWRDALSKGPSRDDAFCFGLLAAVAFVVVSLLFDWYYRVHVVKFARLSPFDDLRVLHKAFEGFIFPPFTIPVSALLWFLQPSTRRRAWLASIGLALVIFGVGIPLLLAILSILAIPFLVYSGIGFEVALIFMGSWGVGPLIWGAMVGEMRWQFARARREALPPPSR